MLGNGVIVRACGELTRENSHDECFNEAQKHMQQSKNQPKIMMRPVVFGIYWVSMHQYLLFVVYLLEC